MNINKNLSIEKIFENAINYHQQKDLFNAELNYVKILKIDPFHIGSLNNLGLILINKKIREVGNYYKDENLPDNIYVNYSADTSDYIKEMLSSLSNAISNAIVSVMLLVIASLGIRSALMVGISIPTSFLIAITLLALSGGYVNMMVMFGLLVSV